MKPFSAKNGREAYNRLRSQNLHSKTLFNKDVSQKRGVHKIHYIEIHTTFYKVQLNRLAVQDDRCEIERQRKSKHPSASQNTVTY